MNFNFNAHVSDDEDDNEVNYVLFFSSKKCKYSKKLIGLMKEKQFKKNIQQKLQDQTFQIFDVVDLYKSRQPIPNYIKSVPILITSDPVSNEVVDIVSDGNEVYKWILGNTERGAYTGGGPSDRLNYSCKSGGLSFDPSKIKGGDGFSDPSQFLEPIEPKGKSIDNDFSKYDAEYSKVSGELGLNYQERFKNSAGGDDKPAPKRTGVGGSSNRGGGFASVGGKKKSSTNAKGPIGAYNS